jgi:hypothetical protein
MSFAWNLADDLANMCQFHSTSYLDLTEKRTEHDFLRTARLTPKGMNKIQSNSSSGARIFRESHCNEDYLLRILLDSGFGAICGAPHIAPLLPNTRVRQLNLIDHVIIGSPAPGRSSYFSFKEGGVIS